MHTLTLRQSIDLINDCDGVEDTAFRESRYQSARVLTQLGIVSPVGTVTRGQTARFNTESVCYIAFALALYDVGFERPMVYDLLKTQAAKTCLADVVQDVQRGWATDIVLEVGRLNGRTQPYRLLGSAPSGAAYAPVGRSPIVDSQSAHIALTRFDASGILFPIIRQFGAVA